MISITPCNNIEATITLPGSKTITHRALIAASLARGKSTIKGFLKCKDTSYTMKALEQLNAKITQQSHGLDILGLGGPPISNHQLVKLFLGESGTSLRLLLGIVCTGYGRFLFEGFSSLSRRPVMPLVNALIELGANIEFLQKKGYAPLLIKASGLKGGTISISGRQSSQYISSLLMCAPYARSSLEITVQGEPVSAPYIDVTLNVMSRFGIQVQREAHHRFNISAEQVYRPTHFSVEGDASTAAFFWATAAVTGGQVTTKGLAPELSVQGDVCFLEILQEMGCEVKVQGDGVTVSGEANKAVEVDLSRAPDLVPPLSAVALFAKGTTSIRNVSHLKIKESDRLVAIAQEWSRLGARIRELPDGLAILGGTRLTGTIVDPHNDHRIAMALAVIGLKVPGIKIQNEQCVEKSFPGFWDKWEKISTL